VYSLLSQEVNAKFWQQQTQHNPLHIAQAGAVPLLISTQLLHKYFLTSLCLLTTDDRHTPSCLRRALSSWNTVDEAPKKKEKLFEDAGLPRGYSV